MLTADEKNWAVVCHIGALVASFFTGGLLPFLVPLLVLILKGDESPFIAHHARQSLNFRLTLLIGALAYWACVVLGFITIIATPLALGMACLGPFLFFLFETGYSIHAAIRAGSGESAGYPAIPFLGDPD